MPKLIQLKFGNWSMENTKAIVRDFPNQKEDAGKEIKIVITWFDMEDGSGFNYNFKGYTNSGPVRGFITLKRMQGFIEQTTI